MSMQIEKTYGLLVSLLLLVFGCGVKEKMEAHEKAKGRADYIMENWGKVNITDQFPEKYFPRAQIGPFIANLSKNCDFSNKRGKFVDFFTMVENGQSKTAFIYEYILDCDSLRFIYIYDMELSEPELFHLEVEGIEQPNQMIIDPKKQLLYSDEQKLR